MIRRSRMANFACGVLALCGLCILGAPLAHATEVNVVGLFPGKALLSIDGAEPRTLSVGQTVSGVKLLGVGDGKATIEADGKRRSLGIGQAYSGKASAGAESSGGKVVLHADSRGHFTTTVLLNGKPVTATVDSGATMVAMDIATAKRIGLDYEKGRPGMVQTANGRVPIWNVTLDTVKVGDVTISQVEAGVTGGAGIGVVLLGNSFLKRTEMRQEAGQLTLIKRF
jgi:aspartyl protease family protein